MPNPTFGYIYSRPKSYKTNNNKEITMVVINSPMYMAKVGYEAYRAHTGGISLVSKKPIPPFEQLDEAIKEAWQAAADVIVATAGRADAGSNKEGM